MASITHTLQAAIADLEQREAAIASAAELISLDRRIAAAMALGQAIERQRIATLIDLQLEHLSRSSSTAIVLTNLKKLINQA